MTPFLFSDSWCKLLILMVIFIYKNYEDYFEKYKNIIIEDEYMEFRRSTLADVDDIMKIIKQAQEYLKSQQVMQWQNNYPNIQVVEQDIKDQNGYVIVDDGDAVGTVTLSFDGEITYDEIYDGAWQSDLPFSVIHRIAIHEKYKGKGLSSIMMDNIVEMCRDRNIKSIRVDTHEANKSMQKLLEKTEFEYCGIIYLLDGSKRLAYEKII